MKIASEKRLSDMITNQRMQDLRLAKYGESTTENEKILQRLHNNEKEMTAAIE